jgi:hypothetical protein
VSADVFTAATQLAILAAGRTPVWSTQDNATSNVPPAAANAGVALQSSVRTLVHVSLRQDVNHRTVRLSTSATLSGTYTITIDGTVVTVNGALAATLAELVDNIATAINANVTVAALVTAVGTAVSPSVTHNAVLITGDGEADFSVNFTHSGAAVLVALADPTAATLRPWWFAGARVGNTPPQVWAWSGDTFVLDRRGFVQRFDCAGLDRLFVQLSDRLGASGDGTMVTYGVPIISIGPCLSEAEAP